METQGPTYLGRYDRADHQGVHLLNVGVHDNQSGITREDYIARSLKFGIKAEHRALTIATDQVTRISQLVSWQQALPSR